MNPYSKNPVDKPASDQEVREQAQHEAEKTPYVERPKSVRILAWVLAVLMIIGVLLYFGWISGLIHV